MGVALRHASKECKGKPAPSWFRRGKSNPTGEFWQRQRETVVIMQNQAGSVIDIWSVAAERLKSKSEQCYRQWFQPVVPVRFEDDGLLVLGVPDDFFGEWLENNYGDLLHDVLSDIHGADFSYVLEPGHIAPPPPPEAAPVAAPPVIDADVAGQPMRSAPPMPASMRVSLVKHSFENFVVSEENRYAHMAVKSAVESPGLYNPLYVYGASGVGKTHLLQAAVHAAQTAPRPMRVRYTACSELLDNFYDLLSQRRSLSEFRSSLRDVDILLVDDVHMLAGKTQMQEEFFNLFNVLYQQQKQIILTSDKQPCEIKGLEARLVTRFESGVTQEIGVPEIEGRLAILRMMREDTLIKVKLGDSILEFLAQHISSSVRRLKGCFMRLASYASMRGSTPLTVQQAEELLSVQIAQESVDRTISMETIQKQVAGQFGISVADILGTKRPKNIAEPRMVAMYLCRRLTSHSLPEIGSAFGKTHATILNAVGKVPELCEKDETFRRTVQQLEHQLKRG